MRLSLSLIPLLVSSAACSQADQPQAPATPEGGLVGAENPAASARASAGAQAAERGGARAIAEDTGTYQFAYAYPAQAGAWPGLKAYLDEQADAARAGLAKEAESDAEAAAGGDFPFRAHSLSTEWKVVADLPRFLSLSAETSTYAGGAHGNYGKASLVYDKQADRRLEPLDLFLSPGQLWNAVSPRFCAALDRERERRRGIKVDRSDANFGGCPKFDELVLLIGSSDKAHFDRIALYAGPYVAGPYAEGAYEINLDVDAAVMAVVRPEYRAAFALRAR